MTKDPIATQLQNQNELLKQVIRTLQDVNATTAKTRDKLDKLLLSKSDDRLAPGKLVTAYLLSEAQAVGNFGLDTFNWLHISHFYNFGPDVATTPWVIPPANFERMARQCREGGVCGQAIIAKRQPIVLDFEGGWTDKPEDIKRFTGYVRRMKELCPDIPVGVNFPLYHEWVPLYKEMLDSADFLVVGCYVERTIWVEESIALAAKTYATARQLFPTKHLTYWMSPYTVRDVPLTKITPATVKRLLETAPKDATWVIWPQDFAGLSVFGEALKK